MIGVAAAVDGGGGGAIWAAAAAIGGDAVGGLSDLQARRKQLLREREQVAREIRNAERKRARLLERARGLSNEDLLAVMGVRAVAKAKPKAKAVGKAKAKAKAKAAADAL